MSISRSQAAALAEGFLDNIGTDDKGDLQPRETFTELFLLAGEFIEQAQVNLEQSKSNASGLLSKSLQIDEPQKTGNVLTANVMMNFYGDFVNSGVRGTKSGSGKYAFKSAFPSKDMVKALQAGINRAKLSTSNVNRNKTVISQEKKNLKISDIEKAYGAGRNIKMYGIEATGFIDKAIQTTSKRMDDRLGDAFKIDILNSLTDFK